VVGVFVVALEGIGQLALSWRPLADRIEASGAVGRRLASVRRARAARDQGRPLLHGLSAYDAELGWVARPGIHDTPGGRVTVDRQGRRRTSETPRVGRGLAVVGDSFTFGDEVADAQAWAWRLAEVLDVPVHNHAALGYGLDQAVLRLERDVLPTEPVAAVLGVTAVMELRTALDWDAWAKPRFIDHDPLRLQDARVLPPAELLAQQPTWATAWVAELVGERLRGPSLSWEAQRAVDDALRDRAVRAAQEAEVPLLVVWMGAEGEYDRPAGQRGTAVAQWAAWCDSRGVACLDTTHALAEAHDAGVTLTGRAHWTPAGNAIVAEAIAEALSGLGWIQ
jgi:hypothetical protein